MLSVQQVDANLADKGFFMWECLVAFGFKHFVCISYHMQVLLVRNGNSLHFENPVWLSQTWQNIYR